MKKWLKKLASTLKRVAGKDVDAFIAIVGSVAGAVLSFFGKAVALVAENAWVLTVFVAGPIGEWLIQKDGN